MLLLGSLYVSSPCRSHQPQRVGVVDAANMPYVESFRVPHLLARLLVWLINLVCLTSECLYVCFYGLQVCLMLVVQEHAGWQKGHRARRTRTQITRFRMHWEQAMGPCFSAPGPRSKRVSTKTKLLFCSELLSRNPSQAHVNYTRKHAHIAPLLPSSNRTALSTAGIRPREWIRHARSSASTPHVNWSAEHVMHTGTLPLTLTEH